MRFTLLCRHVFAKHARHFSEGARKGMTMLAVAGRQGHDFWAPWMGVALTVLSALMIEMNALAWREEVRVRHAEDRACAQQGRQLIHSVESTVEILQAGCEEDQ